MEFILTPLLWFTKPHTSLYKNSCAYEVGLPLGSPQFNENPKHLLKKCLQYRIRHSEDYKGL